MSDKELKIGIIGHGFVGKATDCGFSKNTNKFIVDPKNGTNIDQLAEFDPELIFCLRTNTNGKKWYSRFFNNRSCYTRISSKMSRIYNCNKKHSFTLYFRKNSKNKHQNNIQS